MTRAEMIDAMWAAKPDLLFVEREDFARSLDDWDLEPVEVDGVVAFVFVIRGPEFHYHSLGTGKRQPLKRARERIGRQIAEHGYATTRTPKGDACQQRVNEMFGFAKTGEDELDVHYRIERMPCR
jgi:hypothetical protein